MKSQEVDGLSLNELPDGTKLTVKTQNTVYDFEIRQSEVWMIGHRHYCPDWTKVDFHGSTFGGSVMKPFWIGVGMHMEWFSNPADGIITSSAVKSIVRR